MIAGSERVKDPECHQTKRRSSKQEKVRNETRREKEHTRRDAPHPFPDGEALQGEVLRVLEHEVREVEDRAEPVVPVTRVHAMSVVSMVRKRWGQGENDNKKSRNE